MNIKIRDGESTDSAAIIRLIATQAIEFYKAHGLADETLFLEKHFP